MFLNFLLPDPTRITLAAVAGCDLPTKASVSVVYGDGQVTKPVDLSLTSRSWSVNYSEPGEYPCFVEIFNLASRAKVFPAGGKVSGILP